MHTSRTTLTTLAALAAVLTLGLAACSDSTGSGSTAAGHAISTGTTPAFRLANRRSRCSASPTDIDGRTRTTSRDKCAPVLELRGGSGGGRVGGCCAYRVRNRGARR